MNNELAAKIKATLCTLLLIVWFLICAFRLNWIFKIHKKEDIADTIEMNIADEEGISRSVLAASAPAPVSASVSAPASPKPAPTTPKSLPKPAFNTSPQGEEAVQSRPPLAKPKPDPKSRAVEKNPRPAPVRQPIPPPKTPPAAKAVFQNKNTSAANTAPAAKALFGKGGNGNSNTNNSKGQMTATQNTGAGMSMSQTLAARGLLKNPAFKEKFNQNGTIRVEVSVHPDGTCKFIRVVRSNTANIQLLNIVKQKTNEIKFKKSNKKGDEFGYIEFKFKVTR